MDICKIYLKALQTGCDEVIEELCSCRQCSNLNANTRNCDDTDSESVVSSDNCNSKEHSVNSKKSSI